MQLFPQGEAGGGVVNVPSAPSHLLSWLRRLTAACGQRHAQ